MKINFFVASAMLCLGLACVNSQAAILFSASLSGPGENPPNASPGIGFGLFTLSDDLLTLNVDLSFSGLTAPASAAHIHCCAGPGTNAPVVLNFVPAGFPTGVTAGTFNHTFTLATDLSGISSTNFVNALFAGTAYANIHNANFPGGEIRDQLAAVVPEPGSWGMLAAGLLLLAGRRRVGAIRFFGRRDAQRSDSAS